LSDDHNLVNEKVNTNHTLLIRIVPDTTDADESPSSSVLTTVQRARVENNRLKALQIRKAKAEAEAKL